MALLLEAATREDIPLAVVAIIVMFIAGTCLFWWAEIKKLLEKK